jgi:hypothetical protein
MKNYLKNLVLFVAGGFAVGLLLRFFTVWQACILIFLALIVFFVFRIADGLVVLTRRGDFGVLSRQLSNLYVLTAWKGVPSDTLANCNAAVAGSTKLLSAWKTLNRYRFLGDGMTLEEADSAAFDECEKQRRWIAELTPERIASECNKKSSSSDPEPGPELPRKTLCPKCAKAYVESKQKWAKILASEKMGKSLYPHEYAISAPPCPLPQTKSQWDKDGWYVTCDCGFEKRGLGLDDAFLEEEEHAMTHDPALRLSHPDSGRKTQEEQINPSQSQ